MVACNEMTESQLKKWLASSLTAEGFMAREKNILGTKEVLNVLDPGFSKWLDTRKHWKAPYSKGMDVPGGKSLKTIGWLFDEEDFLTKEEMEL